MPKITRLFIRSGMIFFLLALAVAVLLELPRAGLIETDLVGLIPLFWHFLLVGWITQIIMGVSIWMFPRKKRGRPGGGEKQAWIAFYCINTGLIMRAITEPASTASFAGVWVVWGMVGSALLQVAGGMAYVAGIWYRVRGKRKRRRKNNGG